MSRLKAFIFSVGKNENTGPTIFLWKQLFHHPPSLKNEQRFNVFNLFFKKWNYLLYGYHNCSTKHKISNIKNCLMGFCGNYSKDIGCFFIFFRSFFLILVLAFCKHSVFHFLGPNGSTIYKSEL